jgi:hypothetical protein
MADAWLKFYPQDWRADERLRNCGLAARGLWMELLSLMHRSERYGYLLINGKAPSERQLAVQVGATTDELRGLVSELESEAVFSRDRHGTIYSRRMIRDEKKAQNARKNGKHGGNPKLTASREEQTENPASDNLVLNLSDNGGDKAQKPEARGQSQKPANNTHTPSLTTPREKPPPGIRDAATAFEYVCRAADWRAANDTQRQNGISIINGWLALGCTLDLILEAIAKALKRDPSPTRSLKRFDSTVRGMRRDQLGGELPVTPDEIRRIAVGVANKLAASG